MLYGVIEELIPASQHGDHHDLATSGTIDGFSWFLLTWILLPGSG